MKKFILKLILCVCIVCALVLGINAVYVQLDVSDKNDTDKFKRVPENIQLCNFGSSHGQYGLCYDDYGDLDSFNFSLTAQSPAYDYRILQNYKDNISEGAIVFITVSYFSFYGIPEEQEVGFEDKNNRYYSFLPPGLIKQYNLLSHISEGLLPVLSAYENIATVLMGKSVNTNADKWNRVVSEEELEQDVKDTYYRHIVLYRYDDNGNRIINEENLEAIYAVIDTCREIKATPILITVPYLEVYTDMIKNNSPDFYEDFYGIVNDIVEETGVEYYDYAFDERFAGNRELFMNCDHLNRNGALLFTDILMDEVVGDRLPQ